MSLHDSIRERKQACRRHFLALRAGLDPARRDAGGRRILETLMALPEIAAARVLFCFISNPPEVDTRALIDRLREAGKTILAPRIPRGADMLAVPFESWDAMERGALGILTPRATTEWRGGVDVSITPGLAFTPGGARLGYGRGYYDRWLGSHSAVRRIAIGFDSQVTADLPVDTHDVPMEMIVTEERIIRIG